MAWGAGSHSESSEMIYLLIVLVLLMSSGQVSAECEYGTAAPCPSPAGAQNSCYNTYAEAYSALRANPAESQYNLEWSANIQAPSESWSRELGQCRKRNGYDQYWCFWYLTPGYCIAPPVSDSDGDGISDSIDPFPNDPTPFQYRLHQSQKDQNGNITWLRIITDRFTPAGTPITMSYGTYDPNAITITEIGAEEWLPSTNLAEQELTGSENETVNISPPPTIQTLTPGQDNTGNSAELDYLADIVSNTKATADNQAKNQVALEGIAAGIGIGNKLLSELTAKGGSSGGSGAGSYPNQETKDGEIISQLQAMNDKLQDDAAGRSSMTSQAGQGGAHLSTFKQGVTEEEKAGFGNDMDTSYSGAAMAWLRDFINDNPFTQGLLDSGIQASAGSCSMSFQVMNRTHTFNLCFMAPALQNAGTILLALTSMLALFVIVRH